MPRPIFIVPHLVLRCCRRRRRSGGKTPGGASSLHAETRTCSHASGADAVEWGRRRRRIAVGEEQPMATTQGYVGTIEVETRGTARIWFGLTESRTDDNWVKIAGKRAWFTMNLEASD